MYKRVSHTKKFNTDVADELKEYDEILNDPLSTIISERREKLSLREYDADTKASISDDKMILVVSWERKELI